MSVVLRDNRTSSTRFCTVAVLLLTIGALTFWNTTELVSFYSSSMTRAVNRNESHHNSTCTGTRISDSALSNNSSTTTLPEALLLPVMTQKCCGTGKTKYELTCLTKRACDNNTLYPFTSVEQQELLTVWTPPVKVKMAHRQQCQTANDQLRPPITWCSNSLKTKFPMGCSLFSMGGGSGPYDRALVFPSSNLIFCGIPKAGITQWLQFLRFTLGAQDYQSLPYYKTDTQSFYIDRLKPRTQQSLWRNYTKAILIREPAERLLSAYLDKVTNQTAVQAPFGTNVTFAEFVDILSAKNVTKVPPYRMHPGLSWYSDPHWRPQAWSCGLSENMPEFDYIGSLDRAAFHTKQILDKVGLWETHGTHYRISGKGRKKGNAAMTWPPLLNETFTKVGFQQDSTEQMDTHQHNKNSHSKFNEYYTPELLKKVKELYWMDFKLWDALQQANKMELVSGKDIAKLLNPQCR